MSKAKREKNEKGKAWLRRELSPYRSLIAVLSVLAVCIALASVAFAYLVRYLIDAAAEKNGKQLLFFAAVLFALLLLRILAQMLNAYQTEKCRAKMYAGMKQKLFGALLYADYAQTERYHSGDMLSRLTFDAAEVAADTTKLMPALSGGLVRGAGAFCALFALDPLFTTLYAIGAAALISLGILLRKKAKAYQREVSEAEGKSRVFMQESLGSVVTLKAYGAEQKTAEKSRLLLGEYCDKRMKKARFRACLNGGFSFLSGIGLLFAVVWCCVGIVRGRTDYGTTLSVVLLLGQLQQPLTALSSLLPLYYAREASGERLAEIDDFPGESCGISDKTESSDSFSRIAAQDLVFGYGEEKIFEGACAEFARGNIVCITGKSGAGKTAFKYLSDRKRRFFSRIGKLRGHSLRPLADERRSGAVCLCVAEKFFIFGLRCGNSYPVRAPGRRRRGGTPRSLNDRRRGIRLRSAAGIEHLSAGGRKRAVRGTASTACHCPRAPFPPSRAAARRGHLRFG